ncbi:hypothetical protein AALP_AA5G252800 [Arabis alpina]|uniref:FBD domain-containing protein n=1 Tax=Arabis alpina TaxID=50452 RepID=A0A087GZ94_ARAAL|nr:hypothetical protein AALP_AA5G252800 [Arabis alpina]
MVKRPDVSGLINGISNVETLHLTPNLVDVISRSVKRVLMPVFKNLFRFSLGVRIDKVGNCSHIFLNSLQKLETLIIQDLNGYTTDVYIPLNQVKVLHVLGYRGTTHELERLKSFTRGRKCLKLVRVEIAQGIVVDDGKVLQIHRGLMTLLGVSVSSKCKIEVSHFI